MEGESRRRPGADEATPLKRILPRKGKVVLLVSRVDTGLTLTFVAIRVA